jgi:phosphoglycolate phosphatase-like HAD superfamily hydrolase
MKLVIFDIDGTLTQTSQVDSICFARALAETHQLNVDESDWADCPHVSDTGVVHHIFQQRFGRAPHSQDEDLIRSRLVSLLEEHREIDRTYFAEVPGAREMLKLLKQKRDWHKAIATGCWRRSAEMKLGAASIEYEGLPGGFAEDGIAREMIVSAAISRSSSLYQRQAFDRIVSIGDGVWDVQTASALDLAFIGIASGARAAALTHAGAKHVIPDFEDTDRFFALLEVAEVPGG